MRFKALLLQIEGEVRLAGPSFSGETIEQAIARRILEPEMLAALQALA